MEDESQLLKTIVAGGRDFNDYDVMCHVLDDIFDGQEEKNVRIISGGARGADKLGERYAYEKGFGIKVFPADWDKHGKAAGPIRNKQMAEEAFSLIVFWDGESRGSANMIENGKKYCEVVHVFDYEGRSKLLWLSDRAKASMGIVNIPDNQFE